MRFSLPRRLCWPSSTESERQVAEASVLVSTTQDEGSLAAIADFLSDLAMRQDQAGHVRYAGVTRVNLAVVLLWQGRARWLV